jgi:hypothetical protein
MRFADLDEPSWVAKREAAAAAFPEIAWEHSHVVETDDGELVTYCVYVAPDAQMCRDHAAAAEVPADKVTEMTYVEPGGVVVGPAEPMPGTAP